MDSNPYVPPQSGNAPEKPEGLPINVAGPWSATGPIETACQLGKRNWGLILGAVVVRVAKSESFRPLRCEIAVHPEGVADQLGGSGFTCHASPVRRWRPTSRSRVRRRWRVPRLGPQPSSGPLG